MKTCLLVMPLHFYSFARIIGGELEAMGFTVTLANDEYPQNFVGRILGKLDLPIARWWTRTEFTRRFLTGRRWDLVLILKGRGLGPELATAMKAVSDRVVGYHFDSLNYDRACRRWGSSVDRVSTFDYRDADERNWPLVELFSAQTPIKPPPIRYRISAIQRNHSNRLAYMDRVLRALGTEDSYVFLYELDIFSCAMNALRNPGLYWRWRKHISFKALSYEQYIEALSSSDFTLDYAHPVQTGATMRCFEALAMGIKVITNNPNVARSPHFDGSNTIVYGLGDDPTQLKAQVEALRGYRPEPFQRSPKQFLTELIG